MTPQEELEIDYHLLFSSNLRPTSIGYRGLTRLLLHGSILHDSLSKDYSVFVNFTKVLDHLRLEYEFITNGVALKPNAKENYRRTVMYGKPQQVIQAYAKKPQPLGKDQPDFDKPGWCDRRYPDEKDNSNTL
ncbi:hypothetical protein J0383_07730 [Flavobacterium endoglycinae]|uniref:Uncharacterized protein n=1 Tax=Flavobacterium endoglycinae TaxID=2816357 RepID=A0ABX7QJ81_9FLAO|nr:hypothetical protein [Flavobacterium endoglycinae]QSW90688.1 hypothetical protein J0383_07730 [Flavobacterium endoglycinae]